MKTCTVCKKEMPATLEYFPNCNVVKSGLKAACKKCTSRKNIENQKAYYKKNKAKVNAKNLENYYKKNPKVIKEAVPDGMKKCCVCLEFLPLISEHFGKSSNAKDGYKHSCKACRKKVEYEPNKDKIKIRQDKWYSDNKERVALKGKAYKDKHKERYQEYEKKYYQDNMEKIKEASRKNLYRRVEEDVSYKLLQRYRKRLWDAVKGNGKTARTIELVGCSKEELSEHLENQFAAGMNWDNYGKWHVDHILPCSSFDFSKESHQRECFHYKNLQPLWAADNWKKSNKILVP